MNEAETRAELIDPLLREAGWGVVEGSKILREHHITKGRIMTGGLRAKPEIADYILVYNNQKIAVIEAKKADDPHTEGLTQAKAYAKTLHIENTYCTNGKQIYHVNMATGHETDVDRYPTPDELWGMVGANKNDWHAKFNSIAPAGTFGMRYYQEIAVNKALDAMNNFITSCFNTDGSYKDISHTPNPSAFNCKYCPYSSNNLCAFALS